MHELHTKVKYAAKLKWDTDFDHLLSPRDVVLTDQTSVTYLANKANFGLKTVISFNFMKATGSKMHNLTSLIKI